MKKILTILLFIVFTSSAFASDVDRGFNAYDKGHYKKAIEYWTKAADKEPTAAYQLGLMHLEGTGVSQDMKEAKYWLCKAAGDGSLTANSLLEQMSRQFGPCLRTSHKHDDVDVIPHLPSIIAPKK